MMSAHRSTGDVVHHHQEHAPGLEVQPVSHRARSACRLGRGARDVDPAARAPHLMPVMLDGLRPGLGQVGDLVGVPHPQVPGPGQVSAARAGARREMRDRLVRVIVPRQVRSRRAGLLARPAAPAPARPALRRLPPRLVIGARRHRRVPRVPGDQPLQSRDLLRLLRQLSLQFRVLSSQLRVLLPQLRIRPLQRGHHIRRIRRIGHGGTTSRPALSKQIDTGKPACGTFNCRDSAKLSFPRSLAVIWRA